MKVWTWFGLGLLVLALVPFYANAIEPETRIETNALVLYLDDPYLYVGESNKVKIFDITNRANPALVTEIDTPDQVLDITTTGKWLLVGVDKSAEANLMIIDKTDINSPQLIDTRFAGDPGNYPSSLHAVGSVVYVGMNNGAVNAIEINENGGLTIVASVKFNDFIADITSSNSRVYIATWFEVNLLDLNLNVIDTELSIDFNGRMDIDANLLGIAEGLEGVTFYDISNPDDIVKKGTVDFFEVNESMAVALRQNYCYVAKNYYRGFGFEEPPSDGGLRIVDYEFFENSDEIDRNNVREAFDVIAHAGYVYVAENSNLAVFRHGPLEEDRPTATPTMLTPTPTPTYTPTPTQTPRLIATATPKPGDIDTPTPTNTPFVEASPTPMPSPTPTNPAAQSTPTPGTSEFTTLFMAEFDGEQVTNDLFNITVPFTGTYAQVEPSFGFVPSDPEFSEATDGKGMVVVIKPGEAVTMLTKSPVSIPEGNTALLRVNVLASRGGANVALAAIDGSYDSSVSQTLPYDSARYTEGYKRLYVLTKPISGTVVPLVQVSANATATEAVTLYFDKCEVIAIPDSGSLPMELLDQAGS